MDFFSILVAKKIGYCRDWISALFAKKFPDLPVGYQRLAGIQMDASTYYAITDFKLTGGDTLRFAFSANRACNVLGCYTTTTASTNYSLYATTTAGGKYLRYDGGTYNSVVDTGERYDVVITPTGSNGMKNDETWTAKDFTAVSDLLIGSTSVGATSAKLDGAMYGNIEVDGKLKLIPCKRISDNAIGYYDAYSKTFYEPVGDAPTPITI